MKKVHSIRTKIVLLAVVPMLLVWLILLAYTFAGGIDNTRSAVISSIDETARISAQAIVNQLNIYETAVSEAASNELFQDPNADTDSIMTYLNGVMERNGFLRIGYTDENGINQKGSDFSGREYFKNCREKMTSVTSDPYSAKDGNGALSVLFCAPIVRDGSFCGIVYGAADAKLFSDIISGVLVGEGGENFIVDSTGAMIANNDYSIAANLTNYITLAQTDSSVAGQAEVVSRMLSDKTGSLEYKKGNTTRAASFVPIDKGSGWELAVTVYGMDFIKGQLIGTAVLGLVSVALIAFSIVMIARTSSHMVKPVIGCTKRIELLADGDLMSDMEEYKSDDETGILVESTRRNISHLNSMIGHISESLEKMAGGDFTGSIEGTFRGDFAPIKQSLDNIMGSLRTVLLDIDKTAEVLEELSTKVVDTSAALSGGVQNQTAMMDEINEAFAGMRENVRMNAENTANVVELASRTKDGIHSSGEQMEMLLSAMRQMSESSKEMQSINDVISNIAFQTHILALNAAIEAATAGEAGKGFAIVADEVGNLAAKSGESASKISALIKRTVDSIESGMELAQTVAGSFEAVTGITDEVEKNIADISASSEEQAACIETVAERMNDISAEVQNTAASAHDAAEISERLKDEADTLDAHIRKFTLN